MKRELIVVDSVQVSVYNDPFTGSKFFGFPNRSLLGEFSSLAELKESITYLSGRGQVSVDDAEQILAIAPNIPGFPPTGGLSGEHLYKGLGLFYHPQRMANLLARGCNELLTTHPPELVCKLLRSQDGETIGIVGFQLRWYLLRSKYDVATFVLALLSGQWNFYCGARMITIEGGGCTVPFNPVVEPLDAAMVTETVWRLNLSALEQNDFPKVPMQFFFDADRNTLVVFYKPDGTLDSVCFDKPKAQQLWERLHGNFPLSPEELRQWSCQLEQSALSPESRTDIVLLGTFYAERFFWGELLHHFNVHPNFDDPRVFAYPEMNP